MATKDSKYFFEFDFLPNLAGAAAYDKWKSSNSGPNGDYTKWVKFRDAILAGKQPAEPQMSTKNGKYLVAAAKMSVTDIGATYPFQQTVSFNTNITDGQTITTTPFNWTVSVTPTPDSVQFWVDGVLVSQQIAPPFSYPLAVADGVHQLGVCAYVGGVQTCYDPLSNAAYFASVTVNTAPVGGAPLTRFAHFKNNAWSQIFNRKCNPAPSSNGFDNQGEPCPVPWNDGFSDIDEITDPVKGEGLDFNFGPGMPRSSGHGIQIADVRHILVGFPVDFDLEWDIKFPAVGNPNGFPPYPGDPGTDEWNVILEFTDAGFQSNGIGIANFVTPKPVFYVTAGIGIDNQKRRGRSAVPIVMDKWYHIVYKGRLSKGNDGKVFMSVTPENGNTEVLMNVVNGPTSNPADGNPYVELGWYGMDVSGKNQMRICGMRNNLG